MIYSVLAYKDVETEKFNPPMLFPFDIETAIETCIDGVKKGKIEGAEFFNLFALGTYNTANAKFDLLPEPKLVAKLGDYVKKADV